MKPRIYRTPWKDKRYQGCPTWSCYDVNFGCYGFGFTIEEAYLDWKRKIKDHL